MKLTGGSEAGRFKWAAERLKCLMPQLPMPQVLDIGAGKCEIGDAVRKLGLGYQASDLDARDSAVVKWNIEERGDHIARCGCGLLLEVIEHCNNPVLALENILDRILPGGFLIMTTPNPLWSRSRLHALLRGVPACFTQSDLEANHHVYTAWPHILEFHLKSLGASVLHYDTLDGKSEWPKGTTQRNFIVRSVIAAALMYIEYRDPRSCGMAYGLIARKSVATEVTSTLL